MTPTLSSPFRCYGLYMEMMDRNQFGLLIVRIENLELIQFPFRFCFFPFPFLLATIGTLQQSWETGNGYIATSVKLMVILHRFYYLSNQTFASWKPSSTTSRPTTQISTSSSLLCLLWDCLRSELTSYIPKLQQQSWTRKSSVRCSFSVSTKVCCLLKTTSQVSGLWKDQLQPS